MPTHHELVQMQSLPMEAKVVKTQQRIKEWYEYWQGKVYVSFSGGKDSTVLLHLVRDLYPHVPAVFINTGLEYPEIIKFVRTIDNVTWLRPRMPFTKVIEKYGYPVVSKEQARFVFDIQTQTSLALKNIRMNGNRWGRGKINDKWIPLTYAPFGVSHKCCEVMKENPAKSYEKKTGLKPYLGIMVYESSRRTTDFIRFGCNAFENKRPISKPMSFWFEIDVWEYIRLRHIPYSSIYDMGYDRTGCMFCMFGVHLNNPNKFQLMYKTHPKLWDYCINKLGCGKVMDYIHVSYTPDQMEMDLGV